MKKLFAIPTFLAASLLLAACAPVSPAAPAAAPAVEATAEATEAPAVEATATEAAAEEAPAKQAAPAAAAGTIPEVAAAAGNFATLLTAVKAAGLADELSGEGPFTVFAPTDEAFAKVPADTLKALLADPQGQLTQILLYHVVAGKVMAADVKDGLEAVTLQGAPLKFTVGADGSVKIGDVNIVATDVAASNGVIHVIDAVLMPPAK